ITALLYALLSAPRPLGFALFGGLAHKSFVGGQATPLVLPTAAAWTRIVAPGRQPCGNSCQIIVLNSRCAPGEFCFVTRQLADVRLPSIHSDNQTLISSSVPGETRYGSRSSCSAGAIAGHARRAASVLRVGTGQILEESSIINYSFYHWVSRVVERRFIFQTGGHGSAEAEPSALY